jgi:hypothetical protein
MRIIKPFKLTDVPQDKITYAVTSEPDYEMQRIIIAEEWPEYNEYTVIQGSHCSCYGFDDTQWDATVYTKDEINKLLAGWKSDATEYDSGYSAVEGKIASLWHFAA